MLDILYMSLASSLREEEPIRDCILVWMKSGSVERLIRAGSALSLIMWKPLLSAMYSTRLLTPLAMMYVYCPLIDWPLRSSDFSDSWPLHVPHVGSPFLTHHVAVHHVLAHPVTVHQVVGHVLVVPVHVPHIGHLTAHVHAPVSIVVLGHLAVN